MISRVKSMISSVSIIQAATGKQVNFCQFARKLVYFGEIHSIPAIVKVQQAVLEAMTESAKQNSAKVHVFLEHFSIEDQILIDNYMNNVDSEQDLLQKYEELSSEGHDIEKYIPIFKFAKSNLSPVSIRGAFIPRQYARMLVKEG